MKDKAAGRWPHRRVLFRLAALATLLLCFQNCGGFQVDPHLDNVTSSNKEQTAGSGSNPTGDQTESQGAENGTGSVTPPSGLPMNKSCRALKKFTYVQQNAIPLQCSPGNGDTVLFDVQVPAEGRAFTRVSFDVFNFAQAGAPIEGTHSWAGLSLTGDSSFSGAIKGSAGQSLCPGQGLQSQQLLSYGLLNSTSKNVKTQLRQYTSWNCSNGSMIVQPGARLEVWVEDPDCAGKNLAVSGYFRDIRAKTGQETPFALSTATQDVLSTEIILEEAADVVVYGQMEATLPTTANRCGSQLETAAAVIGRNGGFPGSTSRVGWPVSGGETHVAVYPAYSFGSLSAGPHRLHLSAAVDQTSNANRAKVGLDHSGDTVLAAIIGGDKAEIATEVTLGRHVRIMPLGDSITLGYEDMTENTRNGINGGYRYHLAGLLANRNFKFNFVGGIKSGNTFSENAHEGHSGWRIEQITAGLAQHGWVTTAKPDVVLLHIGTNDIFQNYDLQNSPGRLSALLDQIYADAPGAAVVVAKLVPWPGNPSMAAYITDYNNSVALVAAQKRALGRRVYEVDMNSALDGSAGSTDFCADQAHPSNRGYSRMAEIWLRALVQLF